MSKKFFEYTMYYTTYLKKLTHVCHPHIDVKKIF